MDGDISTFLSALAAIVIIDLVLAGDNAIVIALAARSLPQHLQTRAIIWGTVGAIFVRSALTVVVVWLLKIPGLLLAGGLLLVWIAYRLLLPEDHDGAHGETGGGSSMTFWGAMRTIVIADAIMGLDNVLGVAGAAHGNYLLVVVGLLISIPIVVWGSTMVLKLVDRFPVIAYVGAGVLAFTAVKMVVSEPFLQSPLKDFPLAAALLYLIVPAVLWAGFVKNHRKVESRIHARLAEFDLPQRVEEVAQPGKEGGEGGKSMLRVLVPVDGSRNAEHAVRHVLREYQRNHLLELYLLNVQAPFSRHIARFVSKTDRESFHREQAEKALQPARALLDESKVPYQTQYAVGNRADVISDTAQRLHCHHIVLGTARRNSITRMVEDSTTDRVLELTNVPVEVVPGEEVSKYERYGIPIGIFAFIGLLLLMLY